MSAAATAIAPPAPAFHTISLFVNNKPGVLVRVSLVFSRRGFNIESLVVSPAAEGRFSRMTITCSGDRRRPRADHQAARRSWSTWCTRSTTRATSLRGRDRAREARLRRSTSARRSCRSPSTTRRSVVDYGSDSLMLQVHGLEREARRLHRPAAPVRAHRPGALRQDPDGAGQARHLSPPAAPASSRRAGPSGCGGGRS